MTSSRYVTGGERGQVIGRLSKSLCYIIEVMKSLIGRIYVGTYQGVGKASLRGLPSHMTERKTRLY